MKKAMPVLYMGLSQCDFSLARSIAAAQNRPVVVVCGDANLGMPEPEPLTMPISLKENFITGMDNCAAKIVDLRGPKEWWRGKRPR